LTAVLTTVFALAAILAPSAVASPNTSPSKAKTVQVGVPFTGSWPGSDASVHWWRLPTTLRPGDEVQLAIDNHQGLNDFCLVPPVDDFGAGDALDDCSSRELTISGLDRVVMPYDFSAGQPFLVVGLGEESTTYSITIERIVTLVNIGMVIPPQIPASFVLAANLTYGDNTPAADGVPAYLQWRYEPADKDNPAPFVNVATALSSGGVATFAGSMPSEAQGGTVQMRACVAQPGGADVRCGAFAQTTVAVSACYRALVSRRARARAMRRTKRKLRRARARNAVRAKQRLKRKLKVKRRKLAKAKRAVKAHC
jgi:hypothetical protein